MLFLRETAGFKCFERPPKIHINLTDHAFVCIKPLSVLKKM